MNDAVAKAFLRSKEARMIVASFLSEVTGIDKSVLMNATYTGGEIPKRRNYEKMVKTFFQKTLVLQI